MSRYSKKYSRYDTLRRFADATLLLSRQIKFNLFIIQFKVFIDKLCVTFSKTNLVILNNNIARGFFSSPHKYGFSYCVTMYGWGTKNDLSSNIFCFIYRALVHYRFFTPSYAEKDREILFGHLIMPIKYILYYMIQRRVKKDLWSHGMGRHSEQELYGIAERDLLAVSEILGQKKFLFGEKPCLADAAVFAFVCGATWECPQSPFAELTAKTKAQNLQRHAQRMKELYFPDWDDIISKKPKSAWS